MKFTFLTKQLDMLVVVTLVAAGFMLGSPHLAEAKKARRYYLTKDVFQGDQALTACERGFHMASLWEIFNLSLLRYDTDRGTTAFDSGLGPPNFGGWVRTGHFQHDTDLAGQASCDAWTTNSEFDNGSVVGPTPVWGVNALSHGNISPWLGNVIGCNFSLPVWCVED